MLTIYAQYTGFSVNDGPTVNIAKSGSLRLVLGLLASARGELVSLRQLCNALWSGSRLSQKALAGRIYTLMHRLRVLGLGDIIETLPAGWRISKDTNLSEVATVLTAPVVRRRRFPSAVSAPSAE